LAATSEARGRITVIARTGRASRDARLWTGYGDVAIQEPQGATQLLDRHVGLRPPRDRGMKRPSLSPHCQRCP
jgi:hypothetical protein